MICLQKECFNYHVSHFQNLDAFISRNHKPGALEIPLKILKPWRLYLCLPVKCGKWRPQSAQLIADPHAKPILNFLVWNTGADLSKLTSFHRVLQPNQPTRFFPLNRRISRSRMRTRVWISPPVPFKYGYSFTRQKRTIINAIETKLNKC